MLQQLWCSRRVLLIILATNMEIFVSKHRRYVQQLALSSFEYRYTCNDTIFNKYNFLFRTAKLDNSKKENTYVNSSSVWGFPIGVIRKGKQGYALSPTSMPYDRRSKYRIYIAEFWNMRLSCALPGHSGTTSKNSILGPTTACNKDHN